MEGDMAAATIASNLNKAIVTAICNNVSLDQKSSSSEIIGGYDIDSLFSNILAATQAPLKNPTEVIRWVTFASNFPGEADGSLAAIKDLNEDLTQKAVLLGDGLKPSVADIVVFCALHSFVSHLPSADMQRFPNVLRWMDYIQNTEAFSEIFGKIVVNKPEFEHFGKVPGNEKASEPSKNKKENDEKKKLPEKESTKNKKDSEEKGKLSEKESTKSKKDKMEKKKLPEKETSEKETEASIAILNIQVGIIRKAWKHPSADSLLVEEIDIGGGNLRQVVSGLAKYYNPVELSNRRVVLITNVKPGKLRDVMSSGLRAKGKLGSSRYMNPIVFEGMFSPLASRNPDFYNWNRVLQRKAKSIRDEAVLQRPADLQGLTNAKQVLCASNQDHTLVEPLIPPEGALPGESISFSGYEGKPEDVLNPKKKQLDKITPHLFTDDKGMATYKGIPFMTSAGPCTSSISNASIK